MDTGAVDLLLLGPVKTEVESGDVDLLLDEPAEKELDWLLAGVVILLLDAKDVD